MSSKYSNNQQFRQQEHDRINTALSGGLDDDGSQISLDLKNSRPELRCTTFKRHKRKINTIFMYYDDIPQYQIQSVSDIKANDAVFAESGSSETDDHDMLEVYKACTRALHAGLFVFERGDFDCPNKFLVTAGLYNSRLPRLKPNRLFPYYFRSNSPIKGAITLNRVLDGRHIIVVNVGSTGDLSTDIPDRTIIYLGGPHDERDIPFIRRYLSGSIDRQTVLLTGTKHEKRFARLCWPEVHDERSRNDDLMRNIVISSPFPHTWMASHQQGPNVAMCMSKDGHFGYWPTTLEPKSEGLISRISLKSIPLDCFPLESGFMKELSSSLEEVFEGAWVMKGDCLQAMPADEDTPAEIIYRLKGGYFRCAPKSIKVHAVALNSRLKKLIVSLGTMSSASRVALGFQDSGQIGVYDCTLAVVAKLLNVNIDVLAAYITDLGPAYEIFRGLVGYAGRQFVGPLNITEPTPIGVWMVGRLFDTGTGLLYHEGSDAYHSVRTVGDVSYLGVCEEPIHERRKLVLGRKLHAEASMWDSFRPVGYFL